MKGRTATIAIKETIRLVPFADVVYGCDKAWWEFRKGLPEFHGLKICWSGNGLAGYPGIRRIDIARDEKKKGSYLHQLVLKLGTVGSGGNSGFQALNLAVQWGARNIILIGFDMNDEVHWYGRNQWHGANNPDRWNFNRWIAAFVGVAPDLARLGVRVRNVSSTSALPVFPKCSLDEALDVFGA